MDLSLIIIVVVLGIYLVWKLMGTGNKTKKEPRRFSSGRYRRKDSELNDPDD